MTKNPFDLTGKVALVTGTSRGLGLGFAKSLASAGADILMTSRTLDSLDEPATAIEAMGREVGRFALDVRDHDSIKADHRQGH